MDLKNMIQNGVKYANHENIKEGLMILKEIKEGFSEKGTKKVLFIGQVKNSKGDFQDITISKTMKDEEATRFAVSYVVKVMFEVGIENIDVDFNTIKEFFEYASKLVNGKSIEFKTVEKIAKSFTIVEKEFVFKRKK